MCTLILAWQVFEGAPVVLAANRDESLDRPSVPPAVLETDPRVVAPRDEEAGGTWIGYNEHGLTVTLTNRWSDTVPPWERGDEPAADESRSRGLLVRDALREETAEAAARYVEQAVDADAYEGFYLTAVDATAAVLLEWSGPRGTEGGGRMRTWNLDPGVHVVLNVGVDESFRVPGYRPDAAERQAESARLLLDALAPEPGEGVREWRDRAADALGDHEFGVCVHGDGFGTRSASLVTVDAEGRADYSFADGPPCRTEFRPVDLDADGADAPGEPADGREGQI